MAASFHGQIEVVCALINGHADIHSQKKVPLASCSPQLSADYNYDNSICLWFLCAQDGCTALHLSSQQGHIHVVHVLIEANARVNQKCKVMQSVAMWRMFIMLAMYSTSFSPLLYTPLLSLSFISSCFSSSSLCTYCLSWPPPCTVFYKNFVINCQCLTYSLMLKWKLMSHQRLQ